MRKSSASHSPVSRSLAVRAWQLAGLCSTLYFTLLLVLPAHAEPANAPGKPQPQLAEEQDAELPLSTDQAPVVEPPSVAQKALAREQGFSSGYVLFDLPGILSFAVDFDSNTVWLPGQSHKKGRYVADKNITMILPRRKIDLAYLEQLVRAEYGVPLKLNQDNAVITQLSSTENLQLYSSAALSVAAY